MRLPAHKTLNIISLTVSFIGVLIAVWGFILSLHK